MAANFTGTSDQIAYSGLPITQTIAPEAATFAIRFKTVATTNTLLAARWATASSLLGWGLVINNAAANKLTLACADGIGYRATLTGTTTVNDGNWHSVVITMNGQAGGAQTMYVDNTSVEATANATQNWSTNDTLRLSWAALGFWAAYVGDFADVAYWHNVHLTTDEINAYMKGFSPKNIRPEAQELYAPLARDYQCKRGTSSTLFGTTVSAHPRVIGSLA